MEKLLEVEQLTKVFTLGSAISRDRITAVDDISFHIGAGEIFALAGESGCGKSTTARIIMGFEQPTSGVIIHSGKRETKNEKVWFTEGIQAVFQDPFAVYNPFYPIDHVLTVPIAKFKLAKSRQGERDLIEEALAFKSLDWISGYEVRSVQSLAERIANGKVEFVLLLGRFINHKITDVLLPACNASGVDWVMVRQGYGINQIRMAIERYLGDRGEDATI